MDQIILDVLIRAKVQFFEEKNIGNGIYLGMFGHRCRVWRVDRTKTTSISHLYAASSVVYAMGIFDQHEYSCISRRKAVK